MSTFILFLEYTIGENTREYIQEKSHLLAVYVERNSTAMAAVKSTRRYTSAPRRVSPWSVVTAAKCSMTCTNFVST
jgi:hypothetical protein